MSALEDFAARARGNAGRYVGCAPDQALVYGCEDVVEEVHASRSIETAEVAAFVEIVCDREGLDAPVVTATRRRGSVAASADLESESMCITGRTTTVATVLHEMAHLMSGSGGHGPLFRDQLVGLLRRHADVQQAALLHSLFTAVGLEMGPWSASTR